VNINGASGGKMFEVKNGTGNRMLNNLAYRSISSAVVVTSNDPNQSQQTCSAIDYNCWSGMTGPWVNGQNPWPSLFYNPAFGGYYDNTNNFEVHSSTNLVTLNANWSPVSTNYLVGTNMTAEYVARGVSPVDINGNLRPASGPWTIGAYEVNTNYVAPAYTLTLNPGGTTSSRTNGEVVSLTCTNAGLFSGWMATVGSVSGSGCSVTYTVTADATVTASYTNSLNGSAQSIQLFWRTQ